MPGFIKEINIISQCPNGEEKGLVLIVNEYKIEERFLKVPPFPKYSNICISMHCVKVVTLNNMFSCLEHF
jgi:hypothetical protein